MSKAVCTLHALPPEIRLGIFTLCLYPEALHWRFAHVEEEVTKKEEDYKAAIRVPLLAALFPEKALHLEAVTLYYKLNQVTARGDTFARISKMPPSTLKLIKNIRIHLAMSVRLSRSDPYHTSRAEFDRFMMCFRNHMKNLTSIEIYIHYCNPITMGWLILLTQMDLPCLEQVAIDCYRWDNWWNPTLRLNLTSELIGEKVEDYVDLFNRHYSGLRGREIREVGFWFPSERWEWRAEKGKTLADFIHTDMEDDVVSRVTVEG